MTWRWVAYPVGMVEWINDDDWHVEPLVRFFNDELWVRCDGQSYDLPKNWEICT